MAQTQKNNKSKSVPTLEKPSIQQESIYNILKDIAKAFRDAMAEVAQDDIIGTSMVKNPFIG
ncbi:1780_t:CDS:2 [Cetraspora pellucida]|uniref:1780_t:CDS:1 n=1 Tax=Cetraspora pellucida TaxID=1433469 RepID=A0ACA9KRU0_9GLOM|nr:1780_t:CDS:2 [Cetraspora pellucida]